MGILEERKNKTRETKAKAENSAQLGMGHRSDRGVVELSKVWRSFRGVAQ